MKIVVKVTKSCNDSSSTLQLDSKLKKEWFVKAAQSDYHALVALLKKEPKLAAIKKTYGWQRYQKNTTRQSVCLVHSKRQEDLLIPLIENVYRGVPEISSGSRRLFARDECAAARPLICHCRIPVAPATPLTPELWK
ncbi:hypothetical protein NPIL_403511 [Nephila pilipes]|nr:hypothetical protein NPIL_403511 [Nephila pilipes]